MVSLLLVVSVVATVPEGAAQASSLCDANASNAIVGTDGDDVIHGTNKKDVILGLGGDDVIYAGNGKDVVCGGGGNDEIFGGNGEDVLDGGAGTDVLDGGNGKDVCENGETLVSCETGTPVATTTSTVGPTTTSATTTSTSTTTSTTTSSTTSTTSTTTTSSTTVLPPSPDTLTLAADATGLVTMSGEVVFNAQVGGEVTEVVLQDVVGRVIDMVADGQGGYTANIPWSELVGGETYDFVVSVTRPDGSVVFSEPAVVVVPDRDPEAHSGNLVAPAGTDPIQFLQLAANKGIHVRFMVLTAPVPALADLPADLRDRESSPGDDSAEILQGVWSQRVTLGDTPAFLAADFIRSWITQKEIFPGATVDWAAVSSPSEDAFLDFAGSTAADINDAGNGGFAGIAATSFQPAGGNNFTDEPFWPRRSDVRWSEADPVVVEPEGGIPRFATCRLGSNDDCFATFEMRRLEAAVGGLDDFFRPFYNQYPERAYELDISQIREDIVLTDDELDARWIKNFDHTIRRSGIDVPLFESPKCEQSDAENFPIERYNFQDFAGFRITDISVRDSSMELFSTSAPAEAGAYPDTFVGDQCNRMEIGFGITEPDMIPADQNAIYFRLISSKGGADSATLGMRHQQLDATPADDIGELVDIDLAKLTLCQIHSGDQSQFPLPTRPLGDQFCTGVSNNNFNRSAVVAPTDFDPAVHIDDEPWLTIDFNSSEKRICTQYNTNSDDPTELFPETETLFPYVFQTSEDAPSFEETIQLNIPAALRWGSMEAYTCSEFRWLALREIGIKTGFDGDGFVETDTLTVNIFDTANGPVVNQQFTLGESEDVAPYVLSNPLRDPESVQDLLVAASESPEPDVSSRQLPHPLSSEIFLVDMAPFFANASYVRVFGELNGSAPQFVRIGARDGDRQAVRVYALIREEQL